MAREDSYYGNEYLTGAQQLEEDYRLAPGGAADVGNRLNEDVARIASANALKNPLLAPRDSGLGTAAQPVTATSASTEPNALIRPPVAFNMMPVEKRIAWDTLSAKRQSDQAALERQKLETAVLKTTNDQKQEQVRQGRAMIEELSTLTPHDLEKYPLQKAELFRKYPAAAGSLEVDRAIGPLDERYNKHLGIDTDLRKTREGIREKALQKRIDEGFEMVKALGPEARGRYGALVDKDPESAIRYATEIAGPAMRESAIQSLKDAGLSEQEIAQRYGTGPEFKYQAAGEAVKSRAALATERNKVGTEWAAMKKQREVESLTRPDEWAPGSDNDLLLQQKYAYWKSLTPQLRDYRDGVEGMGAREGESLYRGYQTTSTPQQPTTQPVVSGTPAVPGWREKARTTPLPGSRAVATALQSAYVQPTKLAAQVLRPVVQPFFQQATPTATPVPATTAAAPKQPPPLNPAYPEQWVGGKRYIQMPDGKLYLSKVQ